MNRQLAAYPHVAYCWFYYVAYIANNMDPG